jgi:hypothetical protein
MHREHSNDGGALMTFNSWFVVSWLTFALFLSLFGRFWRAPAWTYPWFAAVMTLTTTAAVLAGFPDSRTAVAAAIVAACSIGVSIVFCFRAVRARRSKRETPLDRTG